MAKKKDDWGYVWVVECYCGKYGWMAAHRAMFETRRGARGYIRNEATAHSPVRYRVRKYLAEAKVLEVLEGLREAPFTVPKSGNIHYAAFGQAIEAVRKL